jgi:dolichyl-phosphate-mannose--protein O-mannosyl transferase
MLSFAMHFSILNESGPGDAQMSSLFQSGLQGNNLQNNPLGKIILMRNCLWFVGYNKEQH